MYHHGSQRRSPCQGSAFGLGVGHHDLTNPIINLVLGGTAERPEQARKIPQTSKTRTKSEKDFTSVPRHICDLTTMRMPFEEFITDDGQHSYRTSHPSPRNGRGFRHGSIVGASVAIRRRRADAAPAASDQFETAEIKIDDDTIFVRRYGKGAPLLMVHGFPRTSLMWRYLAPQLASNHTVVCVDLRGYGRSGVPASQ